MLKKICLLSFVLLLAYGSQAQDQHFLSYVDKYRDIAIREMERIGIPASIKLAQGILESDAGRSDLARRANNHFGIKCGNDWNGKTVWKKDDDFDDKGKLQESCFRSYRDAESSYIAHSEFLADPAKQWRYGFLFQLEPTDYIRWANGLKKAGYATSATYATKLIDLIERYELFKYDQLVVNDVIIADRPTAPVQGAVLSNNDVKYVLSLDQETVSSIASRNDVSVRSLIKYNEHLRSAEQPLAEGTFVYLQPLRSSYRGRETWHQVTPGEKMIDISLKYGIRSDKLYKRNKMRAGAEPAAGQQIKLKGGKVGSPPKLRDPNAPEVKEEAKEKPVEIIFDRQETSTAPQPGKTEPKPASGTTQPATTTNPNWKPFEIKEKEEDEFISFDDWDVETEQKPVYKPGVDTTKDNTAAPPPVKPALPEVVPVTNPQPATTQYHEITKGDTLWSISQRYNTTVDAIRKLNNLTSNSIKVGDRIRVR